MKTISMAILLLGALMLSGCICVPQYYTPSAKLRVDKSGVDSPRYDVTYSMSYYTDGDKSIGRAEEGRFRELIGEKLRATKHFGSVMYKPVDERSPYHIHFIIRYSMNDILDSPAQSMLLGYSLGLLPSWQDMYLDMSAIVIVNDTKVYSTVAAENLRCYIWLPLLPFGMIWNNWLAWTVQEKNGVNFILNDIIENEKI